MRMRTIVKLILVVAVALAGTLATPAQPTDAKLEAFFKEYLEQAFRLRPMEATQLGDHRFDNLLDDLSAQGRDRWKEHARQTLDELPKRVDYKQLSRPAQIDFKIFEHELNKSL